MSTQVQRRKGTTAQHSTFTGASAELTVDSTKNTVVVHDGATAGGFPLAKETGSTISAASLTLPNGTANGVGYLNGSKVLTSGSALTFDGTNFATTGTSSGSRMVATSTLADGSTPHLDTSASAFGIVGGSSSMGYKATSQHIWNLSGTSEQMRLTSTGLGVGTSSPLAPLHVYRASASSIRIDTDAAASNVQLNFATAGVNKWSLYRPSASADLRLFDNVNAIDVMTWQAGGNVGIGTSSPVYKLDVYGTGTPVAAVRSSATGDAKLYLECAGTNSGYVSYSRSLQALTFSANNSTNHAILDSTGNLGVGVTPSAWNSAAKAIQSSTAATFWGLNNNQAYVGSNSYYDATGTFKYIVTDYATQYRQWQGTHVWTTAASGTAGNAITFTQAMTLDASGNLLVGTTTTTGDATNGKQVVGGIYSTVSGSVSAANATATTMFTTPSTVSAWMVTVNISAAAVTLYAATYLINTQGGSSTVATLLYKGANIVVTMSGYAVQVTQTSGVTQTVTYSAMRIA